MKKNKLQLGHYSGFRRLRKQLNAVCKSWLTSDLKIITAIKYICGQLWKLSMEEFVNALNLTMVFGCVERIPLFVSNMKLSYQ